MKANIILMAFLTSSLLAPLAMAEKPLTAFQKQTKELNAIFKNEAFKKLFVGDGKLPISNITVTGSLYQFTNEQCTIEVNVLYVGAPMPGGPVAMDIQVATPICLPGGFSVGNQ